LEDHKNAKREQLEKDTRRSITGMIAVGLEGIKAFESEKP
jgi:hypothetical protein